MKTFQKFEEQLRRELVSARLLMIDLGYLVGIDREGLASLGRMISEADRIGVKVQLIRVTPRIADLLSYSELENLLANYISRTEESAVRRLLSGRARRAASFCINCKSAIETAFKACPFCGEPITDFLRRHLEEPIDGKYQIISRLGVGGMGEVYKVLHIPCGRPRSPGWPSTSSSPNWRSIATGSPSPGWSSRCLPAG